MLYRQLCHVLSCHVCTYSVKVAKLTGLITGTKKVILLYYFNADFSIVLRGHEMENQNVNVYT